MNRNSSLLAVIFTSFTCTVCLAAEIHVSPSGDDSNAGTKDKPLATIATAQAKARTLKSEGVTVLLHDGVYYLDKPVVFSVADSGTAERPVVYAAAAGEAPIVSGGLRLLLEWKPYRDGIQQAKVPGSIEFDQLFIAGRRQHMARYPNFDPKATHLGGTASDAISPERVARWSDPKGGFLLALHDKLWGDMQFRITGKDAKGEVTYEGGWQNNRPTGPHKALRCVENIFEELDAPGEWYFDSKKRVLYVYPPEGVELAKATIEVPRIKHLVEFVGGPDAAVKHIELRGLTLKHTLRTFMESREPLLRSDWCVYRGGAVLFNGAEDCSMSDCFIDQVGGNAIFVNNYNRRVQISGCHVSEAGANSVSFVGDSKAIRSSLNGYGNKQDLNKIDTTPGPQGINFPADCLVDECLLHDNGRFEKQTSGVNICTAARITVRHASIYNSPRAGVNICNGAFGGHVIEFCDVFNTVLETGDNGAFNSWGRDRYWTSSRPERVAEWIAKHPDIPLWDVVEPIVLRNNRWRCDHGWDIDLDDGSSNYEIYNNLCLAGGIKLREGFKRTVYNNIMVDYTFCPHVWYADCDTTFQRNILWSDAYAAAGMSERSIPKNGEVIDFNLVHSTKATSSKPAVGLTKMGTDKNSIIADARFINPLSGDYRVAEDSPALKLGFQNFPMDQFGVQKPQLKKLARTAPLPGTLEAAQITSGGFMRPSRTPETAIWHGAKLKSIADEREMSAYGLGDTKGVVLAAVPADSPAAKAGLRENDVIRAVDGREIDTLRDFSRAWDEFQSKQRVNLSLWRDQADAKLEMTSPDAER